MRLIRCGLIGTPIDDPDERSPGRIEFVDWLDDGHVIFCCDAGEIVCYELESEQIVWRQKINLRYGKFSLCRAKRRLAVHTNPEDEDRRLCVIDCDLGEFVFDTKETQLVDANGDEINHITNVAFSPTDGTLFICCFGFAFGTNGYLLSENYERVLRRFETDGFVHRIVVSPSGSRLTMQADDDVVSIYNLDSNEWLFLDGERIYAEQDSMEGNSCPGVNHVFHDGADTLIYNSDTGLMGNLYVCTLSTKTREQFSLLDAHNELDVDFENQRIAVTGTGRNLLLMSFEGVELCALLDITKQRNSCIRFSPQYDKLIVGSWDGTVSVYEIRDEPDPEGQSVWRSTAIEFDD